MTLNWRDLNKLQWQRSKAQYPFHATTPISIAPSRVPGIHLSAVLADGVRTWGFVTKTERDIFIYNYGGKAV